MSAPTGSGPRGPPRGSVSASLPSTVVGHVARGSVRAALPVPRPAVAPLPSGSAASSSAGPDDLVLGPRPGSAIGAGVRLLAPVPFAGGPAPGRAAAPVRPPLVPASTGSLVSSSSSGTLVHVAGPRPTSAPGSTRLLAPVPFVPRPPPVTPHSPQFQIVAPSFQEVMRRPVGRTASSQRLDLSVALTNLIGAMRQMMLADLWSRVAELEPLLDFAIGKLLVKDDSNLASVPARLDTRVNVRNAARDAGNWVYSVVLALVLRVNNHRSDFLEFDNRVLQYFRSFCSLRPRTDGRPLSQEEVLLKVEVMGDIVEPGRGSAASAVS